MQTYTIDPRGLRSSPLHRFIPAVCTVVVLSLLGCTGADRAGAPSNVARQNGAGDGDQAHGEPAEPLDVVEKRNDDGILIERIEGYHDESGEFIRHGTYTTFHPNGRKKLELHYVNGVLHGERTSWYDSGQKSGHGYYKHGREDGTWTSWWPNGFKHQQFHYVNGAWHGAYTTWHKNGEMRAQGEYVKGRKQGEFVWWDERGNEVDRRQYVNDVAQP